MEFFKSARMQLCTLENDIFGRCYKASFKITILDELERSLISFSLIRINEIENLRLATNILKCF